MDCRLGADFLTYHSAVLDCANFCLGLGDHKGLKVPWWSPEPLQGYALVVIPERIEIPARTVQLIQAKTDVAFAGVQGLGRPLNIGRTPNT